MSVKIILNKRVKNTMALNEAVSPEQKTQLIDKINAAKSQEEFVAAYMEYDKLVSQQGNDVALANAVKMWNKRTAGLQVQQMVSVILKNSYNAIVSVYKQINLQQYQQNVAGIESLTKCVQDFQGKIQQLGMTELGDDANWETLKNSYGAISNFFGAINEFYTNSVNEANKLNQTPDVLPAEAPEPQNQNGQTPQVQNGQGASSPQGAPLNGANGQTPQAQNGQVASSPQGTPQNGANSQPQNGLGAPQNGQPDQSNPAGATTQK